MDSTSVCGLELLVWEGTRGKPLATDHCDHQNLSISGWWWFDNLFWEIAAWFLAVAAVISLPRKGGLQVLLNKIKKRKKKVDFNTFCCGVFVRPLVQFRTVSITFRDGLDSNHKFILSTLHFQGFCPDLPVHKGITIVFSLFRNHWLAVVYCVVFWIGSCEPVHQVHKDRTLSRVLLSEYNLSELTAFTAILCNTVFNLSHVQLTVI